MEKSLIDVNSVSEKFLTDAEYVDGLDITLDRTIFFPEGGGQPYDVGYLDETPVVHVRREGDQAVLFVPKNKSDEKNDKLIVGNCTNQVIDWDRRFDHMQQHSAQHLISAIARKVDLETTSWNMGREVSFIEVNAPKVENHHIEYIESCAAEEIRKHVETTVELIDPDKVEGLELKKIPDDWTGPLRIVSVVEFDRNPCCGTHVSNLAELEMIKILGTQKGKNNRTQIYFVAGRRVSSYLQKTIAHEVALKESL